MNSRQIFIVEDDITIRAILSAMLTNAGYEVVSFFDGEALLAAVRNHRPHCVLLDICLPGKSGLEILKDLKAIDPVRVIMISGHGTIDAAAQALRDGALDFIQKPFKPADLLSRIEGVLEQNARETLLPLINPVATLPKQVRLTSRETEMLGQVLLGKSAKETSRICGISPRTVEDHRSNIKKKLGAKSSIDLLRVTIGPHLFEQLVASVVHPHNGNLTAA